MAVKHKGCRRYNGDSPAYTKDGKPIKDLLLGLVHLTTKPGRDK